MTNGVRKPREFWISYDRLVADFVSVSTQNIGKRDLKHEIIHCKEVLPEDDSIRVSREDWEFIRDALKPPSSDIKSHYAIAKMDRIERENKEG